MNKLIPMALPVESSTKNTFGSRNSIGLPSRYSYLARTLDQMTCSCGIPYTRSLYARTNC